MLQKQPAEKQAEYLGYLDAARGIAAMTVLIYHYINWKHADDAWAKSLSIVFNGADAVSFFFVLSGFVLSYKYIVLGHSMDIGKFYVNRWFRLWPAYFLTVLLNAMYWFRHELNADYLIRQFVFNDTDFWNEVALVRSHPKFYIPGWTLVIELTMSFFMPFFIVIAQRGHRLLLWLLLAILLITGNMGGSYAFHLNFALGVLLSCGYHYITVGSFGQSKWYRYRHLLLLAAAILYSVRHINRLYPFPETYFKISNWIGLTDFFPFTAIGSFIFLVFIMHSARTKRILQHGILIFFGKISYSVYLVHWLPIVYIFDHWDKIVPYFPNYVVAFVVVLLLCILVTVIMAVLMYKFVELPSIRLGKRFTHRMKPTYVVAGEADARIKAAQ